MTIQALTQPEKDAVEKLKASLPDIKRSANVPEDYKLWGVALDDKSTDERLHVILVKFLRARFVYIFYKRIRMYIFIIYK
jgi:hypothetical protein